MQHADHRPPKTSSAFSAVQRSNSLTGTRRLRPRRTSRSSGATLASKKSGPTPIAAAASEGVSAIRGIDTASFRAIAPKTFPGADSTPNHGDRDLPPQGPPPPTSRQSRMPPVPLPPATEPPCALHSPPDDPRPPGASMLPRPTSNPQPLRLFCPLPACAADHEHSIMCVRGQLRTKGSFGSVRRRGCGLRIRSFVRSAGRRIDVDSTLPPGSRACQRGLPTYSPHSIGSPAVKDASRPTPEGLTAGDPMLQSGMVGSRSGDTA